MVQIENIAVAKKYEPKPYWGCPRCGGNCFHAINIKERERDPSIEYIYKCTGIAPLHMMVTLPGCGTLFELPKEAIKESRNELISEGFEVE